MGNLLLLDLDYLFEGQLNRSFTVEYVDQHPNLALVEVDVVDDTVEVGKWPIDHSHAFANVPRRLEPGSRFRLFPFFFGRAEEPLDFAPG